MIQTLYPPYSGEFNALLLKEEGLENLNNGAAIDELYLVACTVDFGELDPEEPENGNELEKAEQAVDLAFLDTANTLKLQLQLFSADVNREPEVVRQLCHRINAGEFILSRMEDRKEVFYTLPQLTAAKETDSEPVPRTEIVSGSESELDASCLVARLNSVLEKSEDLSVVMQVRSLLDDLITAAENKALTLTQPYMTQLDADYARYEQEMAKIQQKQEAIRQAIAEQNYTLLKELKETNDL